MKFIIYHTNDIHSHLEEFSKIASLIKENKTEDDLLLDAGDFHDFMRLEINGTNGVAGKCLLDSLNYDAISIGNNESFGGLNPLEEIISSGNTTVLSCNLYLKNMENIKGLKKSKIVLKNNLRLLVIGASPEMNEFFELEGIHATDAIEEIKKEILLNHGKYDLCILLSHLGYKIDCLISDMDLGIDVIIGGHSHTEMDEAIKVKNTIIHQSGRYGDFLGKLTLNLDEGKINFFKGENIKSELCEMDKDILNIIAYQKNLAIKNLSLPISHINEAIWHDVVMENPLTNLICDALYKYYPCDFAIMNSGIANCGIKGEVSKLKLLQISPSPLNPTYMSINGENIEKALYETLDGELCLSDGKGSGFRGKFLGRLHVSNNVSIYLSDDNIKININGEPLCKDREYIVMTSDYLQRGTGYHLLKSHKNVEFKSNYIRDVLESALTDNDLILSCFKNRWFKK